MRQLKHLTQSNPTSCVSACIAMLLGLDSDEEIWEDWGRDYFQSTGSLSMLEYLTIRNIKVDANYRTIDLRSAHPECLYLAVVPSLNILADAHQIILDLRTYEGNQFLYDPAKGRKDRKYYVLNNPNPDNPLEIALRSFAIDCEILSLPRGMNHA